MSRLYTKPFSPLCYLVPMPALWTLLSVTRCRSVLGLEVRGQKWPEQENGELSGLLPDADPEGLCSVSCLSACPCPSSPYQPQRPHCREKKIYSSGVMWSQATAGNIRIYICLLHVRSENSSLTQPGTAISEASMFSSLTYMVQMSHLWIPFQTSGSIIQSEEGRQIWV